MPHPSGAPAAVAGVYLPLAGGDTAEAMHTFMMNIFLSGQGTFCCRLVRVLSMFYVVSATCLSVVNADKRAAGAKAFQFIYFFASFWNQFGPNCTSFLVAGKIFISVTKASTKHVLAVPFA